MKKTLLTLALVGASVAAFAQGKITVATDVNTSLVTFSTDTSKMLPADRALAGHPVPVLLGSLPSQTALVFGLYAGTASTSLSLQTSIPINTAAGTGQQDGSIAPTHDVLAWTGLTYMEVKIWEGAYASYEAQVAQIGQAGYGAVGTLFTMTPGTGIAYPNIYNAGGTTWTPAAFVTAAPEPSTFALAGLGAAALMIFRRRK
jgi:hypothetical protein